MPKHEEIIEELWERVLEIKKLYTEAYPDSPYFNICLLHGKMSMNNDYWGEDMNHPINKRESEELHDK